MVYGEIDGKKIVKVIRVFEDGTEESIEGESLKHFLDFESAAYASAMVHGLSQKNIEWKKSQRKDERGEG